MADNEIEQIEHLDFDFEPPCERLQGECSRKADWRIMLGCCGRFFLMCDECLMGQREYFDSHPTSIGTCLACGTPGFAAKQIVVVGKL